MAILDSMTMRVEAFEEQTPLDQARLAAAAYLARYNGRTLGAYRHDLRTFFEWARHHRRRSRSRAATTESRMEEQRY